MGYFSLPGDKLPRHIIEVFNTKLSPTDAVGTDVDAGFDTARHGGWYILSDDVICIGPGFWEENVGKVHKGRFTLPGPDRWLLGLDLVMKHVAGVFVGTTVTDLDSPLIVPSRLLVSVDDRDVQGTVSTSATMTFHGTDDDNETIEDTVSMSGFGSYLTRKKFKTVTQVEAAGLGAETVSVWADHGTVSGIREFRWSVDTNGDGNYGLMAAGYLKADAGDVDQFGTDYTVTLAGYGDAMKANEFVSGYRASRRCHNYSKEGSNGVCLLIVLADAEAERCWQTPGLCWVGDLNTTHPDGTAVDALHRCASYAAGDTDEPLPYCGWTFLDGYCDEAEPKKEPFPKTVRDAMLAAKSMMNSLEGGSIVSGTWSISDTDYGSGETAEHLYECNIKRTVWKYIESVTNWAMIAMTNEEYVAWVDAWKRIRLAELDLANLGADSSGLGSDLIITEDVILGYPSWERSSVVNKVSGWVYPSTGQPYYATRSAEDLVGYSMSTTLFQRHSEEVDNRNITSLDDWKVYADNYLKAHAFPVITQRVTLDSFVPSEHYWSDAGPTQYKPYMDYSDPGNKHIDILATKVMCPDYSVPRIDGVPQANTFVITGIRQSWGDACDKIIDTTLTMRRRMLPSEFVA